MMIKIRMILMTMMTKCNVLCEDKTSISNYAKSWVTYSPSKTQQFNWLVGWLVGLIDKNRERKNADDDFLSRELLNSVLSSAAD